MLTALLTAQPAKWNGPKTFGSTLKFINVLQNNDNTKVLTLNSLNVPQWRDASTFPSGISDAPANNLNYARNNNDWVPFSSLVPNWQEVMDVGSTYQTPDGVGFKSAFTRTFANNPNILEFKQSNSATSLNQLSNLLTLEAGSNMSTNPIAKNQIFITPASIMLKGISQASFYPENRITVNGTGSLSLSSNVLGGNFGDLNLFPNALTIRVNSPNGGAPNVGDGYTYVQFGGNFKNGLAIATKYVNNSHPNTYRIKSDNVTLERIVQATDADGTIPALNTIEPLSSTDSGKLGEIRVTSSFIYFCVATNNWVRTPTSTF